MRFLRLIPFCFSLILAFGSGPTVQANSLIAPLVQEAIRFHTFGASISCGVPLKDRESRTRWAKQLISRFKLDQKIDPADEKILVHGFSKLWPQYESDLDGILDLEILGTDLQTEIDLRIKNVEAKLINDLDQWILDHNTPAKRLLLQTQMLGLFVQRSVQNLALSLAETTPIRALVPDLRLYQAIVSIDQSTGSGVDQIFQLKTAYFFKQMSLEADVFSPNPLIQNITRAASKVHDPAHHVLPFYIFRISAQNLYPDVEKLYSAFQYSTPKKIALNIQDALKDMLLAYQIVLVLERYEPTNIQFFNGLWRFYHEGAQESELKKKIFRLFFYYASLPGNRFMAGDAYINNTYHFPQWLFSIELTPEEFYIKAESTLKGAGLI